MVTRMIRLSVVWAALLWAIGCGDAPSDAPKLVPVSGTVTLDGKALSRARVVFIPTGDTKGFGSEGVTDEEGKYTLKGNRGGAGAVPGTYKVVISKRIMPDGSEVPADDKTPPIDSPAKEKLLPQYSTPTTSTLTAKVPEAGGTSDFSLKSK